jgi:hypothetical protein
MKRTAVYLLGALAVAVSAGPAAAQPPYATGNGPMAMTSVPKGTLKGDTYTYTDTLNMGGQKINIRVTTVEVSPTVYTYRMEMQGPDGKWMTAAESKQTKVK